MRDLQLVESGGHPVVAIKTARVGDFNGKTLSTLGTSLVDIDPDVPEAGVLRSWWVGLACCLVHMHMTLCRRLCLLACIHVTLNRSTLTVMVTVMVHAWSCAASPPSSK